MPQSSQRCPEPEETAPLVCHGRWSTGKAKGESWSRPGCHHDSEILKGFVGGDPMPLSMRIPDYLVDHDGGDDVLDVLDKDHDQEGLPEPAAQGGQVQQAHRDLSKR